MSCSSVAWKHGPANSRGMPAPKQAPLVHCTQILFNFEHCPLFQSRLSIFMRVMYLSGVWAYIVGALSTPTFIIIPIVTIW